MSQTNPPTSIYKQDIDDNCPMTGDETDTEELPHTYVASNNFEISDKSGSGTEFKELNMSFKKASLDVTDEVVDFTTEDIQINSKSSVKNPSLNLSQDFQEFGKFLYKFWRIIIWIIVISAEVLIQLICKNDKTGVFKHKWT